MQRGCCARRALSRHRRRSSRERWRCHVPGHAGHPRSHRPLRRTVEGRCRGLDRGWRAIDQADKAVTPGNRGMDPERSAGEVCPTVNERIARRARGHAACEGWRAFSPKRPDREVEWEGRRYRVNAPRGEGTAAAPGPSSGRAAHRCRRRCRARSSLKRRRRRARAGRHVDVDPLRRVPGRSAGSGGRRRQRRAAPRILAPPASWDRAPRGGCRPRGTRAKAGA